MYSIAKENGNIQKPNNSYLHRRIQESGHKDLFSLFSGIESVYLSQGELSDIARF